VNDYRRSDDYSPTLRNREPRRDVRLKDLSGLIHVSQSVPRSSCPEQCRQRKYQNVGSYVNCLCYAILEVTAGKNHRKKFDGACCTDAREALNALVQTDSSLSQISLPKAGTLCYGCSSKLKRLNKLKNEARAIKAEMIQLLQNRLSRNRTVSQPVNANSSGQICLNATENTSHLLLECCNLGYWILV